MIPFFQFATVNIRRKFDTFDFRELKKFEFRNAHKKNSKFKTPKMLSFNFCGMVEKLGVFTWKNEDM